MMTYDMTSKHSDQIKTLSNQNQQMVKPGIILLDTTTSKLNYHQTQTSSFNGNCITNNVPMIQHYGISSAPLKGANATILSSGGSANASFIIGTHDTRYHPKTLQPGEVQLYDNQGQSIQLAQKKNIIVTGQQTITVIIGKNTQMTITDGNIEINGNCQIDKDLHVKGKISVDGDIDCSGDLSCSQDVTVNGSVKCSGTVTGSQDVVAGGISMLTHTHSVSSAPGSTSPPM